MMATGVCLFMHVYFFDINKTNQATMKASPEIKLTKREHEILQQMSKGLTREEIAAKCFISKETVKMHVKNIYRKLKAKNKIDALIKANVI